MNTTSNVPNIPIWQNTSLEDLPGEIWKDVPGFKGVYKASNLGRIKSLARRVKSNNGRINRLKEKIRCLSGSKRRYLVITLGENNKSKTYEVHRVIAKSFMTVNDKNLEINHINGDKFDNGVSNLEWCTHQENMQHAHRTGLIPKGATGAKNHKRSRKLTDEQVVFIKKNHKRGRAKWLAEKFNVSIHCIYSVWNNQVWGDINV